MPLSSTDDHSPDELTDIESVSAFWADSRRRNDRCKCFDLRRGLAFQVALDIQDCVKRAGGVGGFECDLDRVVWGRAGLLLGAFGRRLAAGELGDREGRCGAKTNRFTYRLTWFDCAEIDDRRA